MLLARAVRASGRGLVVCAYVGIADSALESLATRLEWVRLGQAGRVIDTFRASGVRQVVLLGGISKPSLFNLRPDALGLRLLARVAVKTDDNLLRAVAAEFESHDMEVVSAVPWLTRALAPRGVWGRVQPTEPQRSDVAYGWALAAHLGAFDVGQTVVVRDRTPVALEAIEGTDACITRAGEAGGAGGVVVKRVKPGQDHRFDLPAVGPRTVETCVRAGVRVLAVEAGSTLVMERARMVELADRAGIVLWGVAPDDIPTAEPA